MDKQRFPEQKDAEYFAQQLRSAEADIKDNRIEEAAEKLRKIIVDQREIEDVEFLILVNRWYGQMCIRLNRLEDMRWAVEQAFEEAGRREDDHFLATSYGFQGVYYFYMKEPQKAIEAFERSIELLLPAGDNEALGLAYSEIARGYFETGNTLESLQSILEAIRIFEEVGADTQLVRAMNSAAVFYVNMNDYARALDMGLKSLALREKVDARFGFQTNLVNIGLIYQRMASLDKAREYYHQAIEFGESSDRGITLAKIYNNLGNLEFNDGNTDLSIRYLEKSIEIKKQLGDEIGYAMSYYNLGQKLHTLPERIDDAKEYLLLARDIFARNDRQQNIAEIDLELAEIAMKQGDRRIAESLLSSILDTSAAETRCDFLQEIYDFSARFYFSIRNFEKAYTYQQKYIEQYKRFLDEEKVKAVQEIETRYQLEKIERDKKIARQEAEIYRLENIDLTKRVEEEVKKRQEQQEIIIQKSKLESIGRMAASMAHEIGQPLSAISMGVDIVRQRLAKMELHDTTIDTVIHETRESVQQIREVMDDVRAFSRIQKADILEQIDVDYIIEKTVTMCRHELESFGIDLQIIAGNPGLTLGNSRKLQQVFLNLLANAQDAVNEKSAMGEQPDYRKEIRIVSRSMTHKLVVEFVDNGCGIKSEDLDCIFEPFFTTKDESTGTGLGLSICYGIIRDMKGNIQVESNQSEGTTMRITLPLIHAVEEKE